MNIRILKKRDGTQVLQVGEPIGEPILRCKKTLKIVSNVQWQDVPIVEEGETNDGCR